MGYVRHHAIVVTSYSESRITEAHTFARDLMAAHVSPVIPSTTNGDHSFFVAPDGSKEGWTESERGDSLRDSFVDWLRQQAFEDGSSPYAYVEVQYGDDERVTRVVRSSDEDISKARAITC